ncbi:hypothetical protein ACFLZL_01005 [Thermodesulfobacteriota bacterium]
MSGPLWLLFLLVMASGSTVFAADDFSQLTGRWQRTDGGYVIEVRQVAADGSVKAGYFNPRPINVSRAQASLHKNYIKFEVELRDRGYPGSTYTLVYDPPNDRLIGLYFQAVARQNFDVIFVRMK